MNKPTMQNALVFVGAAGSGKDTAAEAVLEVVEGARVLKFAAALKDMCARVYGWDRDKIDTNLNYKESVARYFDGTPQIVLDGKALTRRQILQHVGTDIFRQLNDDVWLYSALHDVVSAETHEGPTPLWVVTDARFKNEIGFLRDKFERVRVVRVIRRGGTSGTTWFTHISEQEGNQIDVDFEIVAEDGDVESLQDAAVSIALTFFDTGEAA